MMMMKSLLRASLVVGLTLSWADFASARPFQNALPVAPGRFGLGAFGDLYFDPGELMAVGQVVYGIAPNFQGEARFGFGTIDFTFGTFGKYLVFSNEHASGAVHTGFSYLRQVAWEGSFIVSRDFEGVDLRIAPSFRQVFVDGAPFAMDLILGAQIPVRRGLRFQTELALKVKDSTNRIAFGVSRDF